MLRYFDSWVLQWRSENHPTNAEPKCNFYLQYNWPEVRITNQLIWSLKQQPRDPVSPWGSFAHPTLMMYKQSSQLGSIPSHKWATQEKPAKPCALTFYALQVHCSKLQEVILDGQSEWSYQIFVKFITLEWLKKHFQIQWIWTDIDILKMK